VLPSSAGSPSRRSSLIVVIDLAIIAAVRAPARVVGPPAPAPAAIRRELVGGSPSRAGAAASRCVSMYPHVQQLETRRREYPSRRENPRRAAPPPRYKLAVLTWAGAYTVITLLLAVLGPAMASWPLMVRTLVLSVTMVVALTWLIMPRLTRLFGGWLHARA
jgi:sterol desaturase/sphingolipid hydroxylase (fatty acid hydroxylase superfamily)